MRHHRTPAGMYQAVPGGGVPCLLPPRRAAWGRGLHRGGGRGLLRVRVRVRVGRLEDPGGALSCIALPQSRGGCDGGLSFLQQAGYTGGYQNRIDGEVWQMVGVQLGISAG